MKYHRVGSEIYDHAVGLIATVYNTVWPDKVFSRTDEIVKRCNSHDELVEACQEALKVLSSIKPEMLNEQCSGVITSDQADSIDTLEQALAKATK